MAGGIGPAGAEHLVVAGEKAHLDIGERLRRVQRMDIAVDAVDAGQGRQAEIGDDEPLGDAAIAAVILALGGRWALVGLAVTT